MKIIINEPIDKLLKKGRSVSLWFSDGGILRVLGQTKGLIETLGRIRDGKVRGRPLRSVPEDIGEYASLDIAIRPETISVRPLTCKPIGGERLVALVFKEHGRGRELIMTVSPSEAKDLLEDMD